MTMAGVISDDCNAAGHAKMMAMHKDTKMTDRDLALACVKEGGKYVFIAAGNLYQITNQNRADLASAAGNRVSLTGDVSGTTIAVSSVTIISVYYTHDGTLGGAGDDVCQEYYGPGATDITASDAGDDRGTVCAVYPSRRRYSAASHTRTDSSK
jgi:hypothetical protein